MRVTDAFAVVADLKSSMRPGFNKYAPSTAGIYEAALHPVVDIFRRRGGSRSRGTVSSACSGAARPSSAMCAGITIKTVSARHLVERLTKRWPKNLPPTGFKIGIATSTVLVKRVGKRQTPHQALGLG